MRSQLAHPLALEEGKGFADEMFRPLAQGTVPWFDVANFTFALGTAKPPGLPVQR